MMPVMSAIGRVISRWRTGRHRVPTPAEAQPTPGQDPRTERTDLRAELLETAHERDVSIARAAEAEEHARLADERVQTFAALERRVRIAERRALDAERRLAEISEQVYAAASATDDAAPEEPPGEGGPAADLRARLSRAAARRRTKPDPG
jgi:hypothetical protein